VFVFGNDVVGFGHKNFKLKFFYSSRPRWRDFAG
jgi:hypothetical protein